MLSGLDHLVKVSGGELHHGGGGLLDLAVEAGLLVDPGDDGVSGTASVILLPGGVALGEILEGREALHVEALPEGTFGISIDLGDHHAITVYMFVHLRE